MTIDDWATAERITRGVKTIEKQWLDFRADLQKRVGSSAIPEMVWLVVKLAYFAGAAAALLSVSAAGETLATEVRDEIQAGGAALLKLQQKKAAV